MGGLISKLIGSTEPCEAFWKNFPKNIPKINLGSAILDMTGLTCSGGRSSIAINLAANAAAAIGLYAANTQVGFMKSLGKLIPKVFTSDPETNATIFEYLVFNIILFIVDIVGETRSVYEAKTAAEAVENCLLSPIQCAKDAIEYIGKMEAPTCAGGMDKDAGLCYKSCNNNFEGIGPICWSKDPPEKEGWRKVGLDIYNNYPRDMHGLRDKPIPPTAKRVPGMPCTVDYGPIHTQWYCTDDSIPLWSHMDEKQFGPNAFKASACTVQSLGLATDCDRYGQGCEAGYEQKGLLCYENPKPDYTCDLLNCYKKCPLGYTTNGAGCAKDSYSRGVGEQPAQCPKGFRWDGAAACGPTDEYMRHLKGLDEPGKTDWVPWLVGGGALAAVGLIYASM